ncbi:MAG: hypothetical protein K9J27_04175 [Bacteroidales bacterium]|nr:hypothetical protein [Bacteroidales bacterium]MCF8333722.1 hypothetical protein [Bacteroidales bacterium]
MKRYYTLFLFIFFISIQTQGQQVSFQLSVPPGNDFSIDESLNAIINNNSQEPLEVYLKGVVRESEDGQIFEGYSSVITLDEDLTQLNKRNLDKLKPVETAFMQGEYEDYVMRTSKFPPGSYEVCVQIVLVDGDEVIAEECYEKTVQEYLPPSLISPEDGAVVNKSQPYFTWSPVPGSNAGEISYKLGIVELNNNQSPVAAFESNPTWYEKEGIGSPLFRYPVAAREFDTSRVYAWKVTAFMGGNKIAESEIWSFSFEADTTSDDEEEEEQDEEETLIPDQYVQLKDDYTDGYYLLDDYQLRFIYENKYSSTPIRCQLVTTRNEVVARNLMDKKQKPGLNFNTLDMTNRVQPGKTYTLRCEGQLGEVTGLKFQVRKENSDNDIIDGLNLDEGDFDLPDGIFNGGG